MPYPIKRFLEINEDMVHTLLMLDVLFTQKAEDLFRGASSTYDPVCSSAIFSSAWDSKVGRKMIQNDFQHDFARVTGEAYSSAVLAEL